MHESSMTEMKKFIDSYVKDGDRILDVGSQVVSGQKLSYRQLIPKGCEYKGLDIVKGRNVDIVVKHPYKWHVNDNAFSIVISGQAFEHIEYPWLTMQEIYRILRPGGFCCITAPSRTKIHRYPIDTYRFNPDGMIALAKYVNLEIIKTYIVEGELADDCVGIFRKC